MSIERLFGGDYAESTRPIRTSGSTSQEKGCGMRTRLPCPCMDQLYVKALGRVRAIATIWREGSARCLLSENASAPRDRDQSDLRLQSPALRNLISATHPASGRENSADLGNHPALSIVGFHGWFRGRTLANQQEMPGLLDPALENQKRPNPG